MNKEKLPNSVLILILGILSLLGCCFYGIGLILGIIALVLGAKATKTFKENPDLYEGHGMVVTGKVLAIIGILLNILNIASYVWIISTFGWESLQDQQQLQQDIMEYFGQ